ncbi:hypothetical protein SAMN04488511_11423 [Pedobacter suwonensis]|uniref:Uncharacterized protein n=1 Tax=Pedobacter suwonensis TaxID=332999 RepID=A0A1I0TSS0_9SPHI|nr:hypothetical protein [Pedobacter suwonensis]SFA54835.1 hypothetical protein SAMN04488511_11423 [Pedobacter suwonensis]
MDLKEKSNSPDYLKNLKEDIAECYRNGNTIEAYLRNEFGITDIMKSEFPDLKDKNVEDFDFNRVRGNTKLMQGKITTYKQAQEMLDKVLNFKMPAVVDARLQNI